MLKVLTVKRHDIMGYYRERQASKVRVTMLERSAYEEALESDHVILEEPDGQHYFLKRRFLFFSLGPGDVSPWR